MMTTTERPPFRADHVGSLLRPPALLAAREERAAGRISAEALRAAEDTAIREAVALQERIGLKGVTDGEFRRRSWHLDFLYQIGGVTKAEDNFTLQFRNEAGGIEFRPSALRITGKLAFERCVFGEDFLFLKSVAGPGSTPKLTIPSPNMIHYRGGDTLIDRTAYPDLDAFWHDLAEFYAREVAALGELGCTYLQIDDTSLAYLNDPAQRAYVAKFGGDPDKQHLRYIDTFNRSVAGRPAGMTICTHLCRGNFRSSWVAEGGYDYVADALFNELDVDGYFLEYDDERSGGFEPLRFVPKGKRVVLGVVTTKRAALETKDFVKRRVEEAAKFMPLDQLCLGPQCGFASTAEGNALTLEDETAKLALIVETAAEIWGS